MASSSVFPPPSFVSLNLLLSALLFYLSAGFNVFREPLGIASPLQRSGFNPFPHGCVELSSFWVRCVSESVKIFRLTLWRRMTDKFPSGSPVASNRVVDRILLLVTFLVALMGSGLACWTSQSSKLHHFSNSSSVWTNGGSLFLNFNVISFWKILFHSVCLRFCLCYSPMTWSPVLTTLLQSRHKCVRLICNSLHDSSIIPACR